MRNFISRVLTPTVVFFFLISFFQNCGQMLKPQHDGSGNLPSLVVDSLSLPELDAKAEMINQIYCSTCHNAASGASSGGGLDTTDPGELIGLGLIVPGQPTSSQWYNRLFTDMPPTGALLPEDIETLKQWIERGQPSTL